MGSQINVVSIDLAKSDLPLLPDKSEKCYFSESPMKHSMPILGLFQVIRILVINIAILVINIGYQKIAITIKNCPN